MPCVDGSGLARKISTSQVWSVQPCVWPVCAVHMTAGHNALRGSGPGQKPAFEMHWHLWVVLIAGSTGSALRAVRPPNLHITPDIGAISFTPRVRRVLCSVHPWPSWPTPSWGGISAPKGTPAEIIDKLNTEINAGLADLKLKARFADLGAIVLVLSPAEYGKRIAEETDKWANVIKFSGAKAN